MKRFPHRPPALPLSRGRVRTWFGFGFGLLFTPLFMFGLARGIAALYSGLDGTGEYGAAVAGSRDIAAALDRYRARHRRIPDPEEGLDGLAPEFLPAVPVDPWGHPYVYAPTGLEWADVLSYGADGRPGGNGPNADISARFGRLGFRPSKYLHPFVSIVLTGVPLAALLASRRRRAWAAALAGLGIFWAVLLLATVSTEWQASLLPLPSFAVALSCLTGSIATLRAARGAPLLTFLSVVAAYLLLQQLLTS